MEPRHLGLGVWGKGELRLKRTHHTRHGPQNACFSTRLHVLGGSLEETTQAWTLRLDPHRQAFEPEDTRVNHCFLS